MKLTSANAVDPQVVLGVITDLFRRVQPAK
jgi:hypothetical protein